MVHAKLLRHNISYIKNVDWYRSQYSLKQKSLQFITKTEQAANSLEILHKSPHYIVVNKPFDLIMYSYGKNSSPGTPTLFEYIRDRFPMHYDPRLPGGFHVLHRLDSVTSGCVCIPTNYFSQRLAAEAFSNGLAQKSYLALVYGHVMSDKVIKEFHGLTAHEHDSFTVSVPIGEDLRQYSYRRCTTVDKHANRRDYCVGPQNSTTNVKVLEYGMYRDQKCTKLLVKPVTGKRHQIRVHLAYLEHDIVGDMVYGRDDFGAYRTMLHAYKLKIQVNTKQRMFVKAVAADPFVSEIDPDWKSETVVNKI